MEADNYESELKKIKAEKLELEKSTLEMQKQIQLYQKDSAVVHKCIELGIGDYSNQQFVFNSNVVKTPKPAEMDD